MSRKLVEVLLATFQENTFKIRGLHCKFHLPSYADFLNFLMNERS